MQEYIDRNGVTKCPGMHSPELRQLNLDRQRAYDAMTPEERYKGKLSAHRPKRGRNKKKAPESTEPKEDGRTSRWANYTSKKNKNAEYQRKYQEKKRRERGYL